MILTAFTPCAEAQRIEAFWEEASGSLLESEGYGRFSEYQLLNHMRAGNRELLVQMLQMLVEEGRIREAEIWMEGRGRRVRVTRRDLAIAISWYGRFGLYGIMSDGAPEVPPDLQDDDYGSTIAALVEIGWMNCSPEGLFHPDLIAGPRELELIADQFFPDDFSWSRDWISLEELDSLFASGTGEAPR